MPAKMGTGSRTKLTSPVNMVTNQYFPLEWCKLGKGKYAQLRIIPMSFPDGSPRCAISEGEQGPYLNDTFLQFRMVSIYGDGMHHIFPARHSTDGVEWSGAGPAEVAARRIRNREEKLKELKGSNVRLQDQDEKFLYLSGRFSYARDYVMAQCRLYVSDGNIIQDAHGNVTCIPFGVYVFPAKLFQEIEGKLLQPMNRAQPASDTNNMLGDIATMQGGNMLQIYRIETTTPITYAVALAGSCPLTDEESPFYDWRNVIQIPTATPQQVIEGMLTVGYSHLIAYGLRDTEWESAIPADARSQAANLVETEELTGMYSSATQIQTGYQGQGFQPPPQGQQWAPPVYNNQPQQQQQSGHPPFYPNQPQAPQQQQQAPHGYVLPPASQFSQPPAQQPQQQQQQQAPPAYQPPAPPPQQQYRPQQQQTAPTQNADVPPWGAPPAQYSLPFAPEQEAPQQQQQQQRAPQQPQQRTPQAGPSPTDPERYAQNLQRFKDTMPPLIPQDNMFPAPPVPNGTVPQMPPQVR